MYFDFMIAHANDLLQSNRWRTCISTSWLPVPITFFSVIAVVHVFQLHDWCTCISTSWLVYMYFNFMTGVHVFQLHDWCTCISTSWLVYMYFIFLTACTNDLLQCNHSCTYICQCDRLHQWPFTVWSLLYLPVWLMVPMICSSAKTCDQGTLFTQSITEFWNVLPVVCKSPAYTFAVWK